MMRRRATLLLGVVGLALLAAAAARAIYTSSGAGVQRQPLHPGDDERAD